MVSDDESLYIPPSQRLEVKQVVVRDRRDIAVIFQNLDFPARKKDVVVACHDYELLWTQEEPIMLVDAVMEIPQETFDTLVDLVDAICRTIELAYGDYSASDDTIIIEE